MKKTRIPALLLCLCLLFSLCGAGSAFAETGPAKTEDAKSEAVKAEVPAEGEYTLFGVHYMGFTMDSKAFEIESVLILEKGGKGSMSMDDDKGEIASWEVKDGELSLEMTDGSSAQGRCSEGVAALDIYGDGSMLLYYAKKGTDLSDYKLMSKEEAMEAYKASQKNPESKLFALWEELDAQKGAHLSYEVRRDEMGSVQEYDVHCKDGVYYSSCTTKVLGIEGTVVTFYKDGKVFNLYPKDKKGNFVMEMTFKTIQDNLLLLDDLYSLINGRAKEQSFTSEQREFNKEKLDAEVYPTDGVYLPEVAFFYDKDGKLTGCLEGAPVNDTFGIGESVFTIRAIDDKVDETLFDISGYQIEDLP